MTDSARILDAIRRLVRHLRLADRAAQSELGISGAQLFVLFELGKTPALSLNDLAARTRTDQSSVSVVVSRLVDAGLITLRFNFRCVGASTGVHNEIAGAREDVRDALIYLSEKYKL